MLLKQNGKKRSSQERGPTARNDFLLASDDVSSADMFFAKGSTIRFAGSDAQGGDVNSFQNT